MKMKTIRVAFTDDKEMIKKLNNIIVKYKATYCGSYTIIDVETICDVGFSVQPKYVQKMINDLKKAGFINIQIID
jgi:hypothetical protein